MQIPPLEELYNGGDVQQNGVESVEVGRKLLAVNLLDNFLSASSVASDRSGFQREFKIKEAIRKVGQRNKWWYISLLKHTYT